MTETTSPVERARTLVGEISTRRLKYLAELRPDAALAVCEWLLDFKLNVRPYWILNKGTLETIWHGIADNPGVYEFILSLAYEFRFRCFESDTEFTDYVERVAGSLTQFNDSLAAFSEDFLSAFALRDPAVSLLLGNPWVLPILLLEQLNDVASGVADTIIAVGGGVDETKETVS